jgi:RNase adapter protein RapZ
LTDQIKSLPSNIKHTILFLNSDSKTLVIRFSETRRKHPLSNNTRTLKEAIELESHILEPLATAADLRINTNKMTIVELRKKIKASVSDQTNQSSTLITFMSFGFKNGTPIDADFIFDVRCLPNPYWDKELRQFSGQHERIINFLDNEPEVLDMFEDISSFVDRWIPKFIANERSYVTIAIGCTGGFHRSVYLSEKLTQWFLTKHTNTQLQHRELRYIEGLNK